MARSMTQLSFELNRQVGVLVHRSGKIERIIVGSHNGILIPQLGQMRAAGGRLRGVRLVHTHLDGEDISEEDLLDLLFLRLDMLSVIKVDDQGLPERIYTAHLTPGSEGGRSWNLLEPVHPANQTGSTENLIAEIEAGFSRFHQTTLVETGQDRAILVSVSTAPRLEAQESLEELVELSKSAGIIVLDTVLQRRRKVDPRFILGRGKLADIMIEALQFDANLLVFNQELNPSQIRSITDFTDLRVIDRTQLILDIFAGRAQSREGKLQVEMAQLKYMLPRLSQRDDALSRLTGGIGARGPGETKLEIDRRRINDRLARLSGELKKVATERYRRRAQRRKNELPVLSLVGYTNAGKSTLLNTLTNSSIFAEDKLFATLDPTSRRLRFPTDTEVIITDTVGFIRNLPEELLQAFKATLEELKEADLLVHVVDASNPAFRQQMRVVDEILQDLELRDIPILILYNKRDKVEDLETLRLELGREALLVSAVEQASLGEFIAVAEKIIGKMFH